MADIIINDDSRYTRDILRAMLEKHGHKVEEAADGKLGLELVAKVHPDCITIDLSMPVLDGLGVLKELQERGIELGKIVVSADVQKSTRETCIGFGADAFLNKTLEELRYSTRRL